MKLKVCSKLKYTVVSIICVVSFVVYFSARISISKPANLKAIQDSNVRTFIHNKKQLELTKIVKIMPRKCNYLQPISVFIHSAAKYHKRRQIQRNTWVSYAKSRNVSVYFALGMSDNSSDEQIIEKESEKYGDLIEFGFIDDYYNNTLKAISVLRWIHKYCNQSKFILKTDDDILLNIDMFIKNLDTFRSGIHGLLYRKVKANRDKESKWYMPEKYYAKTFYPQYNPGVAYIMSGDVIDSLNLGIDSYSGNIIDIDDVFITGIIANQMEIKRYYTKLIVKCRCFDKCNLFKFGVIFGCSKDNSLEKMWLKWKASTEQICKKSPKKSIERLSK